jgi:hypothetical protein
MKINHQENVKANKGEELTNSNKENKTKQQTTLLKTLKFMELPHQNRLTHLQQLLTSQLRVQVLQQFREFELENKLVLRMHQRTPWLWE